MQYQPRLSGITSTFTTFVSIIQGWRLFHANTRWAGIDCAVAFSRVYHGLVRNPVWRAHSRSSSKHFIHAVYTKYVSRMFMRHCTQSWCQHCKRETMYTAVLVPSRANIFSFLLMFNCSFYNVSTKRHTAVSTLSYVKLVWTQVSHHMHEKHHEINSHDFLCGGGELIWVWDVFNLFTVWWSIVLVFVRVVDVKIDSGFGCGPEIARFYCEHEIDLFFAWVVDIDLISVWGIELDLISM